MLGSDLFGLYSGDGLDAFLGVLEVLFSLLLLILLLCFTDVCWFQPKHFFGTDPQNGCNYFVLDRMKLLILFKLTGSERFVLLASHTPGRRLLALFTRRGTFFLVIRLLCLILA